MRLKSIQNILKQVKYSEGRLEIKSINATTYSIENIIEFKSFVSQLEVLDIFKKYIQNLKQTEIYGTGQNSIQVDVRNMRYIYSQAQYLVTASEALLLVFEKLLPASAEFAVSIKLPDPADFESLVKSMSSMQTALSQVVTNDVINGYVKVNNWEFGSYWLELDLNTEAAVALVAGIAWSAAVVSKKYKECKNLEHQVRSLEIKNESLTDILESQKKITDQLIEHETKGLLVKHFGTDDNNEYSQRLKLAVKTFAELIQQGAEFHPAFTAPETVQNLFPDFSKIETLTTQIKQLEEITKDSENV